MGLLVGEGHKRDVNMLMAIEGLPWEYDPKPPWEAVCAVPTVTRVSPQGAWFWGVKPAQALPLPLTHSS